MVAESKVPQTEAPTVSRLAEEAKRMQDGIASDVARIEALIEDGRLHEAGLILATLKPILTEDAPEMAAVAAKMKRTQSQHRAALRHRRR